MMRFFKESTLPYPQPWEWLLSNVKFRENGYYVDIGANDGISSSNTAHFDLNLGWKGICIEPHPDAFLVLSQNRPDAIKLNLCISNVEGEVDFFAIKGYAEMLSGIQSLYHEDHIARINREIEKHGGKIDKIKIQSTTLKNVLIEHNVNVIDYLSIDTEGSEFEILQSIDYNNTYIKCISTENSSKKNIKEFLSQKGFLFKGQICSDEIYININ